MHTGEWYALQVYTGKEKWVAGLLEERGHEVMLLLYTAIHWWSDRRKRIDRPVFPGYVFCHFDPHYRSPILAVPGVMRIVSIGRTPLPVEQHEMNALARIADAGCFIAPVPYLRTGEYVRIRGGSLDGMVGRVLNFRKRLRVVVSITLLERSVSLEVDHQRLESISLSETLLSVAEPPVDFPKPFPLDSDTFLPVKRFSRNPPPGDSLVSAPLCAG